MRSGSGRCTLLDHRDDASGLRSAGRQRVCSRSTSSIWSPQRHDRVQRGHRLLEDHAHAGAAQLAQPRSALDADQVFALQQDAPA
jgi:hypothetical protein